MILDNPDNSELLINILSINISNYNLPSQLDSSAINKLLDEYINTDSPNPNYLEQIYLGRFSIKIDTRIRKKAMDAYNNFMEKLSNEENFSGILTTTEVRITQLRDKLFEIENGIDENNAFIKMKFNEDWLEESLDFASILQNMIYIFNFVDNKFRISAIPSNESEGVFERTIGLRDKKSFFVSSVFRTLETQYILMFSAYVKYLKIKNINILEVVRWYLKVHLVEEYGIKNFDLKLLETEFPIEVLNNDLHTQFQRLIKMYHLYSEYEEVDLEEVDLETNKNFSELKGINGKKYIYLAESELAMCAHYLFSDQSLLEILGKENKFYINLEKGKVNYKNIEQHLVPYIDLLRENELLTVEDDVLSVKYEKYYILKELFFKHTINYYWTSSSGKEIIDELISNKELQASNTLLSKKEIDYFNYYLNEFFTNGVALRNKYSHGSVGVATEDEHKNNYMWLRYLIVLFIIKMNEEINYKIDCDK